MSLLPAYQASPPGRLIAVRIYSDLRELVEQFA